MDWDKLRIFHAVADAGSLTHAGDALHLSQSAVSRQVRALEESLNTTLFHRHARGLILTEQGELLFDATSAMAKRLDAASAGLLAGNRSEPTTDDPQDGVSVAAAGCGKHRRDTRDHAMAAVLIREGHRNGAETGPGMAGRSGLPRCPGRGGIGRAGRWAGSTAVGPASAVGGATIKQGCWKDSPQASCLGMARSIATRVRWASSLSVRV